MINVICQSTSERNEETRRLFEEIKPLLDEGYSYNHAVRVVRNIRCNTYPLSNLSWYKELVQYGESQGYLKKDYCRSHVRVMGNDWK